MNIMKAANDLLQAEQTKQAIEPLTAQGEISVDEAYRIQLEQIQRKVQSGSAIIGKKIGLTSKAMQEMLKVNQPDYGHLLDTMMYLDGETISISSYLQPKIEFEIAFVLKKDLKGPNVTVLDVLEATDYIMPALELIDSRIRDWEICFEDTVADNGSSAGVILGGNPTVIDEVDLSMIGMAVYKNGKYLDSAASAAVMGNPARAVAWLANALSTYEIPLLKGEVVLAGALTKAVAVEPGDTFTAEFAHLGQVSISFSE